MQDPETDDLKEGADPKEADATEPKVPKRRRGRKRGLVALCVIGVTLVAASSGLWVWHEQPEFCAAVCHETMGSYYESYSEGKLLAQSHATGDVTCLDCHDADPATQLKEATVQLSGDYRLPLKKMETDDSFCLRDGCHSLDDVAAETAGYLTEDGTEVNPHSITFLSSYGAAESPHQAGGESVACADCHTMHRESKGIEYCYSCHHTETFKVCYDCHNHR